MIKNEKILESLARLFKPLSDPNRIRMRLVKDEFEQPDL